MLASGTHLIAADIGNSRMKFARFELPPANKAAEKLPEPVDVTSLAPESLDQLASRISAAPWDVAEIAISSVQRSRAADLIEWLQQRKPARRVRLLSSGDLPLEIDLPHPERAGIDRLLAAVAVNQLRNARRPAAIIDLGTAITVDIVSSAGAFLGGAIAPGLAISAQALHSATDLLPEFDVTTLDEHVAPIGRDTISALKSGLFLGAVGGIRELIARQLASLSPEGAGINKPHADPPAADIFVTGGFGQQVAHLLSPQARYVPHLIPQGIALTVLRGNE